MYTAKVAGQSIDVEKISIQFRLKNPMFDSANGMDWSGTYPFTIMRTPRNNKVFNFAGRLNGQTFRGVDFVIEHFFNGIRLPGDTLRITKVTDTHFEAYIKVGRSDILSKIKNLKLTDLSFDDHYYQDQINTDPDYLYDEPDKSYPDAQFTMFPVKNVGLYKNSWHNDGWLDPGLNQYGPYQNLFYTNPGEFVYNPYEVTPFPYVNTVIDKIFEQIGYTLLENALADDAELAKLCIFNCNIARYIIDLDNGNHFYINVADHLPRIAVSSYLIALRNLFGLDLYSTYSGSSVRLKTRVSIIQSNQIIDISNNVLKEFESDLEAISSSFRFKMVAHGSDAHFSELVKEIDDFSGRSISAYPTYDDLPATANDGEFAYVYAEDAYYFWGYQDGSGVGWNFYTLNLLPYESGNNPELVIEPNVGVLLNSVEEYTDYQDFEWAVPVVDQAGNKENYAIDSKNGYNEFGLQLIFARGNGKTSTDYDYKIGSSFNYDYFPHEIAGTNYALRWDGDEQDGLYKPKGLYVNFWKDWLEWKQYSKPIEYYRLFTAFELLNLDFSKKYFAKNLVQILDEINFTVTNESIMPAKVKAWTV